MRKWIVAAVVVALLAAGLWVRQFFQIDGCLDSGGRWNYDSGVCEY
jgi:hypothetical protein